MREESESAAVAFDPPYLGRVMRLQAILPYITRDVRKKRVCSGVLFVFRQLPELFDCLIQQCAHIRQL
jgi:hypothetical protein